jgi:pyruvate/2-oxoglutarate dehydrogenase complex dihydrolipoamide acyltransferase (E2) component
MPYDPVLPDIGKGTTEGEVREWTMKEGVPVEDHQTILDMRTERFTPAPSECAGIPLMILSHG